MHKNDLPVAVALFCNVAIWIVWWFIILEVMKP